MDNENAERGSGTVLAAGLGLVLVLCLSMLMLLAQATVMTGRAASAADLSALAAADAWRGLTTGNPCSVAGEVAARHDAELLTCVTAPDGSVQVRVRLTPAPWFGHATARSRAGAPPAEQE